MSSALSGATVLLAAGGTGGHLQPALAVAAEARARGASVVVTTPSQVERVAAEYRTFALELKGFSRGLAPRDHLTTLGLLAAAAPRVGRILKEVRPDVAIGGVGSPASRPVPPEPDPPKLPHGIMREIPAAYALKLAALQVPVVAQ